MVVEYCLERTDPDWFLSLLQIIKVEPVVSSKCRRPHIKQFHDSSIKFPLVKRVHHKNARPLFSYKKPKTYFM